MKKFLLNCICFLLLLALCSAVLWIYARKVKTDDYLLARLDKQEILKETSSPKVIFVGGSNLAFGIDCSQVADSVGMPCVNMGLHAGQGMRFIMDDMDPYIKEMNKRDGNIVVIMPEFAHFFGMTSYGESLTLGELFLTDPSSIKTMGWKQRLLTLKGIPKQLSGTIIETMFFPPKDSDFKYLRSNFDSEGDEISHLKMDYDNTRTPIPPRILIKGELDKGFCFFLKNRITEWSDHSIVILFPPTIYSGYLEDNKDKLNELEHELRILDIPFATKIDMFSYPYDKVFKAAEHITYDGVIENSGRVGHLLKGIVENKKYK